MFLRGFSKRCPKCGGDMIYIRSCEAFYKKGVAKCSDRYYDLNILSFDAKAVIINIYFNKAWVNHCGCMRYAAVFSGKYRKINKSSLSRHFGDALYVQVVTKCKRCGFKMAMFDGIKNRNVENVRW